MIYISITKRVGFLPKIVAEIFFYVKYFSYISTIIKNNNNDKNRINNRRIRKVFRRS